MKRIACIILNFIFIKLLKSANYVDIFFRIKIIFAYKISLIIFISLLLILSNVIVTFILAFTFPPILITFVSLQFNNDLHKISLTRNSF